jgi:hypothetical protein
MKSILTGIFIEKNWFEFCAFCLLRGLSQHVREFFTHIHARSMCGCALHRLSYSVMNDAKIERGGGGKEGGGGVERVRF